jgi:Domain of unknown function (DUF4397)
MLFNNLHLATRTARLSALAVLVATLAGCQGISGIQPTSQVRVIDVSPDAPALDIHQNSAAALYNVAFGTVSSYIAVPAGPYTHAAYSAGTQQQLAAVRGTFSTGNQYTVLAGNVAANLQMTVLKDQSYPAPTGEVALRFLDQTTHPGAVDIYLLSPGSATSSVAPLVTAATFGTNTGYIDAPAGTYSIVAFPTGTVPTSAAAPTYTGSQITYPSGSVRTIILIDQPAATPALQIITADDYDAAS